VLHSIKDYQHSKGTVFCHKGVYDRNEKLKMVALLDGIITDDDETQMHHCKMESKWQSME
jgi:hypothetical protein